MEEKELLEKLDKIEVRNTKERPIKSYVLRNNTISEKEKDVVLKYYEKYGIFYENEKKNFQEYFSEEQKTIMEIGFGNGETTLKMALIRPEYNYVAIDVYLKGFIQLLKEVGENNLCNIRLMRFNCMDVLRDMTENNSIFGFHLFFPDPWPKKRHNKRRLINEDFLALLSQKLERGGYIYIVTDWEEYAEEILDKAKKVDTLVNPFYQYAPPVTWRPHTKFEAKGLKEERQIYEIWLEKN